MSADKVVTPGERTNFKKMRCLDRYEDMAMLTFVIEVTKLSRSDVDTKHIHANVDDRSHNRAKNWRTCGCRKVWFVNI